jgi:hypothetical protein
MRSVGDAFRILSSWLFVLSATALLLLTVTFQASPLDLQADDAFDFLPDVRILLYVPLYVFVFFMLICAASATVATASVSEGERRWPIFLVPGIGVVVFALAIADWSVPDVERPWPWSVAAHGFIHRPRTGSPRPTTRAHAAEPPAVIRERAAPYVAERGRELARRAEAVAIEGTAPETVYWALRMTAFELAIDPEPGTPEPLRSAVWRSRPGLVAVVASDLAHRRRHEPLVVGWVCRNAAAAARLRGDLVSTVAAAGGTVALVERFRNVLVVVASGGGLSTPDPRLLAKYRTAIANQLSG